MASPISYIPEPQERAYYEGLFQAADVKKTNNIGGGEAVQFFSRSKLPMEVLKNIWTVADQPSTSSLNRQKFAVAIRLIQLTQNGTKGQGANLATAPGVTLRPAFFDGVSGVSVQMPPAPGAPPPQQQQQQAPPSPGASTRSGLSSAIPPPPGSVASGYAPPSASGGSTGGFNNALVPQDPYSMTPQEQGRYEALFPQYAKPDGFMYGKEAVDLFMKSGVDAQALREIWNMTDRPVDNRLDKVEFAICMHLIVCISKKNLPAPQGQLPPSLRALKSPPQQQQQGQQAPPPSMSSMPPPAAVMPPPTPAQQQPPALQPTLQPSGGMSISDAFEGMNMATPAPEPAPAPTPALPSYVPEEQQAPPPQQQQTMPAPTMAAAGMAAMGMAAAAAPSMMEPPAPAPAVETIPEPAPVNTKDLAKNYQMGDESQELSKLKDVLQKLQAENISLKAQLGSMTEEEKEVHAQLGGTIAEIGNLSQQLQGLRVQVSDAKTKLLEASGKLKAAQEQKGVLSDLITEANATKEAIEEATASIENVTEASVQHQQMAAKQQHAALQQNNNFESNLFGFENAPEPAAADRGLPEPSSMPAPGGMMGAPPGQDGGLPAPDSFGTQSFDSGLPPQTEVPLASSTDGGSMFNQPASSPQGGLGGFPDMAPSGSTDSGFPPQEVAPPATGGTNPFGDERSAFSAHSKSPVPEQEAPVESSSQASLPETSQPAPAPAQQYQYQQPPPAADSGGNAIPTPNGAQSYYQMPPQGQPAPQSMPTPQSQQGYMMPPGGQPMPYAMPTPQSQQGYMSQQPTPTGIATPNYGLARPSVDHNRKESVGGFGSDFVMGGFAPPPGAGGGVYDAAATATSHAETSQTVDSEAAAKLEELKKKYKSAQEIASDAAATHIKLAQEADELRGDADKAEANARSLRASADEKKKGRFGSSGKKKALNRDADNAAQTANDLRKRFLAIQGQASDASAVAMETKREAEKLKEAVEKAEIDMASAASMQDQKAEQAKQSAAAGAAGAPPAGYPQQQPYGAYGYPPPAANGYPPAAYGAPPAGYGQPPAGYGAPGQVPGYAYAQPPPQYQAPYEGDPGFPSSPY
ncbi:unnamed protein product [Cylindrotheca closterium]|uniref:EH domain-containing protein n=1 Tax=Cylindrotheca closterium TaxID=2856 RepID=A0AAD2FY10_9STRA|nr:unnamed protein product [Cylindrotheca closterium]